MEIIYRNIKEIKPYENNPRVNDYSVDAVAASIEEFGFTTPIVIDKNDVVICGHTRLKAAEQLMLEKVPCVKAEELSDEQVKAFRLADNKVAEKSKWDNAKLNEEIESIADIDMSEFGFAEEKPKEVAEAKETAPMGSGEKMVTCPHCGELIPESEARIE